METDQKMTIAEYFTKYPERWHKGNYHKDEDKTCMCLEGAMLYGYKYVQLNRLDNGATDRVCEAIRELYPNRQLYGQDAIGQIHIPGFNDHPDTTIEDVVKVCQLAKV